MSVALVWSLVAGCVANDQSDPGATASSSQDLALATTTTSTSTDKCTPDRLYTCKFPTPWNAGMTAVNQYWAGAGTSNPAKVMITFLYPTKVDPTTRLATAYYAFAVAGYQTCTPDIAGNCVWTSSNQLAFFYEVPASQLDAYRSAERAARDAQENSAENRYLPFWDGGVGGPLLGRPGGPVGPGGLPITVLNALTSSAQAVRNSYANVYNAAATAGGSSVLAE
jgi:hypothetical protein